MGTLGFQKLNNGNTTANNQLKELKDINKDLDEVNANLEEVVLSVKSLNQIIDKPEIWKLAKMYAPNMELIPLQFAWQAGVANNNRPTFADGNLYYGELQIQLRVTNLDKNTGRHGAQLEIVANSIRQAQFVAMYKGDNGIDMSSETYVFRGFFTDLILMKHHSYDFIAEVRTEFQGFRLGEKTEEPEIIAADFKAVVKGLQSVDTVSAVFIDNQGVRLDIQDLMIGDNSVYNRSNLIESNTQFIVYYGDNNPLIANRNDTGRYFVAMPESPITKDFYIFFGEHDLPYNEKYYLGSLHKTYEVEELNLIPNYSTSLSFNFYEKFVYDTNGIIYFKVDYMDDDGEPSNFEIKELTGKGTILKNQIVNPNYVNTITITINKY